MKGSLTCKLKFILKIVSDRAIFEPQDGVFLAILLLVHILNYHNCLIKVTNAFKFGAFAD